MGKKIISFLLYIIAIVFLIMYVVLSLSKNFSLLEMGRIMLLCGSCFFFYLGGCCLSKAKKTTKPMKVNLSIFLCLYFLLLLTLTLIDPVWGRGGFSFIDGKNIAGYLKNSTNFIPFHTIIQYLSKFNSLYSTRIVIGNLLGNLVALMPLAILLPFIFKKQNNTKTFALTILATTIGIELIQFLTITGRCDIDDIILNFFGAFVLYRVVQIKSVKKLLGNIFLLEKNKIKKEEIKKIGIGVLLTVIIFISIIAVREHLYQNKVKEHELSYNPTLEIVDDSTSCIEILDPFYEDELFIYYFPCLKSDALYAMVNQTEKILIKDLVNNKTKYHVSIARLTNLLDANEIGYIKQNKYSYIDFEINTDKQIEKDVFIEQEDVLRAVFYYSKIGEESNHEKLYLIPKKEGTTKITVTFTETEEKKTIKKEEYLIKINKNLDVIYEVVEESK